jgi:hypothetical protein
MAPRLRSRRVLARTPSIGDLNRFLRELRGPARRSAIRSAVDVVVVTWTLKRQGLTPMLEEPADRPHQRNHALATKIASTVDVAFGIVPVAPTCLRRSLTLKRELSRLGLYSTIHIGVRRVADKVEAHAWLEIDDQIINDDPDLISTYEVLARGELDGFMQVLS